MLSKLAVRRLTKLADYMQSVPREHFHMSDWVAHAGESWGITEHHGITRGIDISRAIVECGMTACALGHAAMIPEFRKAGLSLAISDATKVAYPVTKSGADEDDAASEFFDLTMLQVERLFRDDSIATPKQWAKHCRKFIKENT